MTAIEVITSKEKRRYWTRSEKTRWVLALNEPDANASDVARRAGASTRAVSEPIESGRIPKSAEI